MTTLQPDHVEAATVRGWLDRPDAVTVLDVRTPAEFETAHIRGSYNLPLVLLAEHAEQIAARLDRQVVLVCRSGTRASEAQQRLAGVGADRVHVLDGGITAYTAAVGANDPTWSAAGPAGRWSARSAWSPAPSCWPGSPSGCACPGRGCSPVGSVPVWSCRR